jgi:LysM repeat protein
LKGTPRGTVLRIGDPLAARASELGARVERALASASARATAIELELQHEGSHRRHLRYLIAISVVVAIMLVSVIAARVRSNDTRTITAPMPRPPVTEHSTTVAAPPVMPPVVTVAPPAPAPARPMVEPGDSLWSIAEAHVSDHLGRSATDAETAPYWFDLVRANARNLPHPGDADVIYPGQAVELPTE